MLSPALVIGLSLGYLGLLFAVAAWGDRRAAAGRSVVANAWVYALSMAVYCTVWTYFGSVGRAAASWVWFLSIYLGPTLAMVLAWMVIRKMLRIARRYRITSITDFVASRYDKSPLLGGLVTLIAVVATTPYIALQLQSMTLSFSVFAQDTPEAWLLPGHEDIALWVAAGLALFTILFGTRNLDAKEQHHGIVTAIAVEAVVKLVALLAVGIFVVWGLAGGIGAVIDKIAAVEAEAKKSRVRCKSRFLTSARVHEAILRTARGAKCDCVAMASHGRGGLAGVLLGSETTRVLAHSKVPVLVLR